MATRVRPGEVWRLRTRDSCDRRRAARPGPRFPADSYLPMTLHRRTSRPAVSGIGGLVAGAIGAMALVGWIARVPVLTTFGPGRIPMAPSTAVAFVLFGALSVFREALARDPRRQRTANLVALVATGVTAVLLVMSSLGLALPAEHLAIPIAGEVAGAPIGHMSPLTALTFLLVGAATLALPAAPNTRRTRSRLALASALGVVFVAALLLVAYALGGPILYDSGVIPPALTTAAAFLALGVSLVDAALEKLIGVDGAPLFRSARSAAWFSVVLSVAVIAVVAGAYVYLRAYRSDFRTGAERSLSAVADLKAAEIAQWRRERVGDAEVLTHNDAFAGLVRVLLHDGSDVQARRRLRDWLESVRSRYGYEQAALLDVEGMALVAATDSAPSLSGLYSAEVAAVAASGMVTFDTLHVRPGDGTVRLGVLAAVPDPESPGRAQAVVYLSVDPEEYLFPLVRRWPTAGLRTAATYLVRRDGERALVLTDGRLRDGSASGFGFALTDGAHPAVMAVRGRQGVADGVDDRGVSVLAALRAVPGSPWFLVAAEDREEIFAPLANRLAWVVGLVAVLFLMLGTVTAVVWQDRQRRYYQALARSEARERAGEARHRLTLESIGDGVITTDREGRIEVINQVAEELTGWSRGEAVGRRLGEVFTVIGERSRLPVENPADRAFREKRIVGLANHTLLVAKDGTERPIADSGAPILDDGGNALGVVLVFRDRSEEREAARALEEREQRYRSLFNSQRDAILVLDTKHRIADCNVAFEELFGYRRGELIGSDSARLYGDHADYEATVRHAREHAGEPRWHREAAFARRNGEVFPGEATSFPLRDARTATVSGFVEILRDVTEARRAEAVHRQLTEQLTQAQKLESVGRLAGGVAHDFNNMLAVILGHADLALGDIDPDSSLHEVLGEIRDAAERSAALTRQLLAFARRQAIRPQVLDLNESLGTMSRMLRRLIGENIELAWVPGGELWSVRMDPVQLDQLLANLVVNARDAIDGVGRVTIETGNVRIDEAYAARHPDAGTGEYVLLAVSDDGKGMDQGVLAHLFEPFYTTKAPGEGTGLGLATVYGIVRQNGGFINVYSEPAHGSTFRLYFPRHDGVTSARAGPPEEPQRGAGETILVVEDEEPLLRLATRILTGLGYEVLAVPGAGEAIALAETHGPEIHLLLTDVIMPEMNGRELADRMRELLPDLRVLYMSGYTANVLDHVLDAGMGVVQKPFSVTRLSQKVRQALDGTRSDAESRT